MLYYGRTQELSVTSETSQPIADAFRPSMIHQRCKLNIWDVNLTKVDVSYRYHTVCGKSQKHIPELNQEDFQTVIGWFYESYVILI